jgi:Pre-mRNA 3'-end-processing endonuclease polyadenylation factor C-term
MSRLFLLLENQFGEEAINVTAVDESTGEDVTEANGSGSTALALHISVPPHTARVDLADMTVDCKSMALKTRVLAVMEKAFETIAGLGGD